MAYYTGTEVKVWVVTEHATKGISLESDHQLVVEANNGDSSPATTNGAVEIYARGTHLGRTGFNIADITGIDVSTGAQDEDISYFGTKTPGKIETKSDMSVTITKKKRDRMFMTLAQGDTASGNSTRSGGHGGKHGIGVAVGGGTDLIHDGTIDPKSTLDSNSTISYGYRVAIQLKADSTGTADDGTVIVLRNCSLGDYTHTLSNDAANEESVTFVSMVSPLITSGRKTGNVFDGCETATAAADM